MPLSAPALLASWTPRGVPGLIGSDSRPKLSRGPQGLVGIALMYS
jgi:hypothetical protein